MGYHEKGNIIPLVSCRQRTKKYHKPLGSNWNNLPSTPGTTFHRAGKHQRYLQIGLNNCLSICNKTDQIVNFVRDEALAFL